jgi:flagellar basal-body rod protein FlgC
MGIFDSFNISASGMTAERVQMDLIATNIANINTTETASGGPYQRQVALFQEKVPFDQFFVPAAFGFDDNPNQAIGSGVTVAGVVRDPSPPKMVYDPHNPAANAQGYVAMPNVDLITEMTNMIQASRAYEANADVLQASKQMLKYAMQIDQ